MATLKLKYGRFPVKLTTIAQEISEHVSSVRASRINAPLVIRTKECIDCKQVLALTRDNFRHQKPRAGHQPWWSNRCRPCARIRREHVRKARAQT